MPVRGKVKILVMDDDAMLRDAAGAMLSHIGYEVGYAKDGAEAVELYTRAFGTASPFGAVILDLSISGGMGGHETIQKLRALDPHVKAIVSSGYAQDAMLAHYREYGFAAIMSKPYRVAELSAILHTVLNGPPPSHR